MSSPFALFVHSTFHIMLLHYTLARVCIFKSKFSILTAFLIYRMSSNNTSQTICYLGNGGIAPNAVQCDSSGAINTCCPEGNVCLSNGMCFGTQTTGDYFMYTQDACTDPTGAGCVPNCRSQQYNGGAGDSICGNQFTGFCCFEDHASGVCNCDTGENAFTLPYGTPISTIGALPQTDANELAASMTTISSLLDRGITQGTFPASTLTTEVTTDSYSYPSSTSSTEYAPYPTTPPACLSCTSDESCIVQAQAYYICASTTYVKATSLPGTLQSFQEPNRLTTGAEVGIAVGVVVFVIFTVITGLLLFRARRRRHLRSSSEHEIYQKAELSAEGSEIRRWRSPPAELSGTLRRFSGKPAIELPT